MLFEIKSNPADHKATGEVMVPNYNAEEYINTLKKVCDISDTTEFTTGELKRNLRILHLMVHILR